tara:strand:+ start:6925 stop:7299 length:375 start_codon:yes stop_codon:yes gene_type:complete
MEIEGKEIELKVELKQLYAARRKGCDIGDLSNGKLQAIAVNLLDALDAAWLIYEKQLKSVGVKNFDAFLALESSQLTDLADQFREELSVFFPAMKAILNELNQVMAEVTSQLASGQASGEPQES